MFHVLHILVFRPFLPGGHLYDLTEINKDGPEICVNAALKIYSLTKAYRDTFTLKRAPYLLSYCLYSASAILLQESSKFSTELKFIHSCLIESKEGPNYSFKKPVAILTEWLTRKGIQVESLNGIESPNHEDLLVEAQDDDFNDSRLFNQFETPLKSLLNSDLDLYNAYVQQMFGADGSLSMLSMDNMLSYGISVNHV